MQQGRRSFLKRSPRPLTGRFTADLNRLGGCNGLRVPGELARCVTSSPSKRRPSRISSDVELPTPPQPGDPIETKIGRCIVTSTESMPAGSEYAGRIICRLP